MVGLVAIIALAALRPNAARQNGPIYAFHFAPPIGKTLRYRLDVSQVQGQSTILGSANLSLTAVDELRGAYVLSSTMKSSHRAGWQFALDINDLTSQLVHPDGHVRRVQYGFASGQHPRWIPDAAELIPSASAYLEPSPLLRDLQLSNFAAKGGLAKIVSALNPRRKLAIGTRWTSGGLHLLFFGVTGTGHLRLAKLKIDTGLPSELMGPAFATIELETGVLHSLSIPKAGHPPMAISMTLQP
ncbi:MAG: hypothetical protein ACYC96_03570 [Fimbriimonadaceae bacterium]